MITRNPSLTDQVTGHIRTLISNNGFQDGRIPPETDLASELGVSRTTVRDALSRLEHEGAIYRRQGSGTFVNQHGLRIKSRLENIWSYEQLLEDHGYEPSVRVLDVTRTTPDVATAEALGLDDTDTVDVFEKLFLEDDAPVVLTTNRIPTRLFDDVDASIDDADAPVYEFLDTHCHRTLGYYLSEILPVALDPGQAEKLGVEPGTLALSFDEVGYDTDNQPIVRATSYFRDDRLRFRLIRRKSGT